jgi:hypothetical protein
MRTPILPICFPNGDGQQKRRGDWRWSRSCKRWKICRAVKRQRWFDISGEVLASHAQLGIELLGPLKQEGGWQHETGYGLSAFQVDWDMQQVRYPQGHLSQNWCPGRHSRGEEVIRVSFSASAF